MNTFAAKGLERRGARQPMRPRRPLQHALDAPSREAPPSACPCGGGCPRCQSKLCAQASLAAPQTTVKPVLPGTTRPSTYVPAGAPRFPSAGETLGLRDKHCSVSGRFAAMPPAATLRPELIGSTFGRKFYMVGKFSASPPCNCGCGEYRQYVRGRMILNGTETSQPLCGGNLDPKIYQEDCTVIDGKSYKYGYRATPFPTSVFIAPDQETGCTFVGHDEPSISAESGDTVGLDLDFRGQLVDACDGDRLLATAEWSVAGSATIP